MFIKILKMVNLFNINYLKTYIFLFQKKNQDIIAQFLKLTKHYKIAVLFNKIFMPKILNEILISLCDNESNLIFKIY